MRNSLYVNCLSNICWFLTHCFNSVIWNRCSETKCVLECQKYFVKLFLEYYFWCSNPNNDFCYCPVISYYWWPSEYSKQVKMSNYWSVRPSIHPEFYLFLQTNNLTFLLVYYILKATNNKKWLGNNKSRSWGWSIRKSKLYADSLFHPEMKRKAIIFSLPTGNMLALQNMYMYALELWVSYFVYLSVCQATNERFVSHCFNDFFIHAPKKKRIYELMMLCNEPHFGSFINCVDKILAFFYHLPYIIFGFWFFVFWSL